MRGHVLPLCSQVLPCQVVKFNPWMQSNLTLMWSNLTPMWSNLTLDVVKSYPGCGSILHRCGQILPWMCVKSYTGCGQILPCMWSNLTLDVGQSYPVSVDQMARPDLGWWRHIPEAGVSGPDGNGRKPLSSSLSSSDFSWQQTNTNRFERCHSSKSSLQY